jgi:pimeloyl-ACP methyl ester carboxylesterase
MLAEGSVDEGTEAFDPAGPSGPAAHGAAAPAHPSPDDRPAPATAKMVMTSTQVDGKTVRYGVVGTGPSALFLHGWGLRPTGYRRAIEAMSRAGCRVVAPALPGFGGTPELPADQRNFPGLGAWVGRFLDAAGVDDLALVAGHSFGGGVSTAFTHHQPDRVASLLLVNAVGSPTWMLLPDEVRTMVQRPVWDWGRHFGSDLLHSPRTLRVLPSLLEDFVPNLVGNPIGMFRTGITIRRADLVAEVRAIAARGIPVSVAWSDRDGLVPRSAFDDLRHAAGTDGTVVEGAHAWLIADPDAFGELAISALVDGRGRTRRLGGAIPLD